MDQTLEVNLDYGIQLTKWEKVYDWFYGTYQHILIYLLMIDLLIFGLIENVVLSIIATIIFLFPLLLQKIIDHKMSKNPNKIQYAIDSVIMYLNREEVERLEDQERVQFMLDAERIDSERRQHNRELNEFVQNAARVSYTLHEIETELLVQGVEYVSEIRPPPSMNITLSSDDLSEMGTEMLAEGIGYVSTPSTQIDYGPDLDAQIIDSERRLNDVTRETLDYLERRNITGEELEILKRLSLERHNQKKEETPNILKSKLFGLMYKNG